MSRIIRGDTIVADDWQLLVDDTQPEADTQIIVSLEYWRKASDVLLAEAAEVGVQLPNDVDVDAVWPEIRERPLIALEWPTVGDGRAHSQAEVLRRRLDYKGELRAIGEISRDLVFHLRRCGFDVIVPREGEDMEDCLRALKDFSTAYQPAADDVQAVFARRRHT